MRKRQVYLAAPFFNQAQRSLCEIIEAVIEASGWGTVWSPRLRSLCPPGASMAQQALTVRANKEAIRQSSFVLAVLNYLQTPGWRTAIVGPLGQERELSVPDSGVLWEVGYAEDKVPVFGYVEAPGPLNLMLARTLEGIIVGPVALREFFDKDFPGGDRTIPKRYDGPVV